jgi:hypothetical protein
MRAFAVAVLFASSTVAAGCAGNRSGDGGIIYTCSDDVGVALLSWTVTHQPPTADQGCVGVDHLIADLRSACNEVQIEPIPCISGMRWRYDALPAGDQLISLFAVDRLDRVTARGSVETSLGASVPAQPLAIDLE